MTARQIHVVAGAIPDEQGRVLVARRPDHVHQGGLWEFPGGKLEPDESPEAGLARELAEELGIAVHGSRPLIRIHHDYGDRRILLDVRWVEAYSGTPLGLEGQPLDWVHPHAMDPAAFPAADRPIIAALRLPSLLLIAGPDLGPDTTPIPDPGDWSAFLARLGLAMSRGIRLVQLRAPELDDQAYRTLAIAAYARCRQAGARLLLNRDPARVDDLPRDGLHLPARHLLALTQRPGRPGDLVGASCHNAAELAHAARLGLDYALLSPVKPTATHPRARPLGWDGFAALADPAPIPVYALGGLGPADLDQAIRHGAQGVAGIRGLWPH